MRNRVTPALMAIGGLLLVAWSCNLQPGGEATEPQAQPTASSSPSAKLKPEPGVHKRTPDGTKSRRRMRPIQPVNVKGPKASKPAALPKADKILAIFHSGNVDGEVDPCG